MLFPYFSRNKLILLLGFLTLLHHLFGDQLVSFSIYFSLEFSCYNETLARVTGAACGFT